MIVFHSSPCIVNHPDVSFSRDYLDFGKGFYVTTIEEQARKYARRFLLRGMNAYLNKYELSDDLRNYNARYFDSYDDSWLDFVALCRAGRDKSDYDIVQNDRPVLLRRDHKRRGLAKPALRDAQCSDLSKVARAFGCGTYIHFK